MQLTKEDLEENDRGVIIGINIVKYKQVAEFYERYKDNQNLLSKEQRDLYKKWLKIYNKHWKGFSAYSHVSSTVEQREYYNWLFNYCFKLGLE